MKQYKDLDLKLIRDVADLDFAHFTFGRGQCSCCYGPIDMPAIYWKNKKKPIEVKDSENSFHYELGGKPFSYSEMEYILFKNANNGSGTVTKNDYIKDGTCIQYNLSKEKVKVVCKMLQEQLGNEYLVIEPENDLCCIQILYHPCKDYTPIS